MTIPKWDPKNLAGHHQKRISNDKGCFEELLGISGRDMSVAEYERRSLDAVTNSWGEYEGEGRNVKASAYFPAAAYFVDDALVVAITDLPRAMFRTCFHEHFNRPHGVEPRPQATVGQRRLRYLQKLDWDEKGGMVRNLKVIRNV